MSARRARHGATTGDVLIFLASLSVAGALLYPAWSVRGFRATVEQAIADVETLGAAARLERDDQSRWPPSAPPGEAPLQLSRLGGSAGIFVRPEYRLQWTAWEVVDSVPAPPDAGLFETGDQPDQSAGPRMLPVVRKVGAVVVHSENETLLAELLEYYADGSSFVLDTTWTLVLPERGAATPGPS